MNRRKFSKSIAVLTATSFVPSVTTEKSTMIVHHVFFWLKQPTDAHKLLEGLKTLGHIPQVKNLMIGVPASTDLREVIDNSYHVSELMYFDSLADQKLYQDHPVHQKFVESYSQLWEKVVVYDTLMQSL
jgi:hypothetical protein